MTDERRRLNFAGVVPSSILETIVVDIVFPYMLYQLFVGHLSFLPALTLAAVFPLFHLIWSFTQRHTIDFFGLIALYVIFWVLVSDLVGEHSFFLSTLLHYSLPIGILGLLTLFSPILIKPLLFYVDRYCSAHTHDEIVEYDDYWQESATYRQMIQALNHTWGWGQLIVACALLLGSGILSIPLSTAMPPFLIITCLCYIGLTMWSVHVKNQLVQTWTEAHVEETSPSHLDKHRID